MATKYVLVDFENVQLKKVGTLNGSAFKFKVFLGASQPKIPVDTVLALQPFEPEYIQMDGNGSNALDFHIAFYIGRLAAQIPGAQFHIISKDTGFDPLIRHLKQLGIPCRRSESVSDLMKPFQPPAAPVCDKADAAIEKLSNHKTGRPRALKTLRPWLKALFANQIDEEAIERLIQELAERGAIKVADGKIQYELPAGL